MSDGSYYRALVRCPYYKRDSNKNRIVCEGITPGAVTSSYYRKPDDFLQQMELFCCKDYWHCEICRAIDEKYKED